MSIENPQEILDEVTVTARREQSQNFNKFMSQDFLKSSFFMFTLPTLPKIFPYKTDMRQFSLICESVEFPGKTVNTVDYKIPGYNRRKIAYSKDNNEITTTFIHNAAVPIYKIFNDWVDYMMYPNVTTDNYYYDDYTIGYTLMQFSDVSNKKAFGALSSLLNVVDRLNSITAQSTKAFQITDLGQTFINTANAVGYRNPGLTTIYNVDVYGAYPITVNSMTSNWADDGFHRLTITWAYEYFMINENEKTGGIEQNPEETAFQPTVDEVLRNNLVG